MSKRLINKLSDQYNSLNDPTDIFKLTEEANRLDNKTAIFADVGGFSNRSEQDPNYVYVGLGFIMAMGPEHSHLVLRDVKTILKLARESNLPIINPQEPNLVEELNDIVKNTIEYNKYMESEWLWQLETIEFINYFKNSKKSPWGMSSMGGKEEFVNKYYRELGLDSPERPDRKPNYPSVALPAVEPSQVSPAVSDFDKWTLNSMGIKENKRRN